MATWMLAAAGLILATCTFLPLLPSSHWAVRDWDYPRPQLLVLLLGVGLAYVTASGVDSVADGVLLAALAAAAGMQLGKLAPYTPLARRSVPASDDRPREDRLRILISNVQLENPGHDRVLECVRECAPDLFLAIEVDDAWCESLAALRAEDGYEYCLLVPQDNHYGMALYSRLELLDPEVRHIVQDDVPSIHTLVRLRNGIRVMLHGLHPRPPEPTRDQDSVPRDAELAVLAREINGRETPTVVVGDLNDVAWSATTALFLRLSEMVDPRVGRGFYNTWNANSRLLRMALDHVFHTDCFELGELRVLGHVGSDHFPVLVELVHRDDADVEPPEPDGADWDRAEDTIDRAERRGFGEHAPRRRPERLEPVNH